MKTFGIICLFGILISCSNKSDNNNQIKNKYEELIPFKIKIKKTSFNFLTPYSIDCEEFEEWGNSIASNHIIENKDTINLFVNALKDLERDTIHRSIDVRTKLIFFYQNNQIDTICMNKYVVSINGESYLNNKKMVDIIENL